MTTKRLLIGVLAASAVAGMFFWLRPDEDHSRANEDDSRPMFANRKVASAEFGGRSGWYIDRVILTNGTTIEYAEKENILVAGLRDSSNELLLMPGPQGDGLVAGYRL